MDGLVVLDRLTVADALADQGAGRLADLAASVHDYQSARDRDFQRASGAKAALDVAEQRRAALRLVDSIAVALADAARVAHFRPEKELV